MLLQFCQVYISVYQLLQPPMFSLRTSQASVAGWSHLPGSGARDCVRRPGWDGDIAIDTLMPTTTGITNQNGYRFGPSKSFSRQSMLYNKTFMFIDYHMSHVIIFEGQVWPGFYPQEPDCLSVCQFCHLLFDLLRRDIVGYTHQVTLRLQLALKTIYLGPNRCFRFQICHDEPEKNSFHNPDKELGANIWGFWMLFFNCWSTAESSSHRQGLVSLFVGYGQGLTKGLEPVEPWGKKVKRDDKKGMLKCFLGLKTYDSQTF